MSGKACAAQLDEVAAVLMRTDCSKCALVEEENDTELDLGTRANEKAHQAKNT